MNKKKFLACMMAIAMAATTAAALIPTGSVEAAGLTQATSAEQVKYGSLTKDDEAVLKTLFDFEYYKAQNPELVSIIGDDFDKLFEHFCKCGIFEGRTCNENFDPAAYASAYADLKEAYGSDIMKYYTHFATIGSKENRTLTTVKACAEAGITVAPVVASDVKITPAVYKLAMKMGTTEFGKIQNAINTAVKEANERGAFEIVVTTAVDEEADKAAEALAVAEGLEKIGTVSISEGPEDNYIRVGIYIVKGEKGYAAYKTNGDSTPVQYVPTTELYRTKDFVSGESDKVVAQITHLGINTITAPTPATYTASDAGEPAYRPNEKNPTSGNHINFYADYYRVYDSKGTYDDDSDDVMFESALPVAEYATSEITPLFDLYGVVDNEGNVYEFKSTAERDTFVAEYNEGKAENRQLKVTRRFDPFYHDPKGTADTVYDIGLKIDEKSDTSVDITLGLMNEENGFVAVKTYEYIDYQQEGIANTRSSGASPEYLATEAAKTKAAEAAASAPSETPEDDSTSSSEGHE